MRNTPLSDIAHRLSCTLSPPTPDSSLITGYQVDSRLIEPGELFFALRGEKTDGHCHLAQVRERGGVGAVVSASYSGPDFGLILLPVPDVLEALQSLARGEALQTRAQIVGVTGTMGKTTTKDFLATLLEKKYRVGKTYSSFNTKLTLPITILNMKGDEEVWVLEMGMGEPGDIGKLVQIAPPDLAILTQIAMAHYGDHFPDGAAGVARAKAEIFSHPKTKRAIFFHGLNRYPEAIAAISCGKWTYSLEDRSADYFWTDDGVDERGVRAYRFSEVPFKQPHVLHNLLGAISAARALKMEWDEINAQIPHLKLPKMRFETFEKEGILFVNDAYNANPESVKAALSCFPEPKSGGKRIAVLGRMVDLGPYSKAMHEEVGKFAQGCADYLLTISEEARILNEAFAEAKKPAEHFTDLEAMAARLKELMRPGDAVLVKGSRGLCMERIFTLLES